MTTDTAVLPTMTAPVALPRARARGWFRQLGVDTGYALVGLPMAIASFVLVVTGVSAGAGLVVVWVGIAVLALTLLVARGLATAERQLLPAVLRRPLPRPAYRRADPEAGAVRRLLTPLRDPQAWLDGLHGALRLPFAILAFVVTVTMWSLALAGLTYGGWDWALPHPPPRDQFKDLPMLLGFESTSGTRIVVYTAVGIVCAVIGPFLLRGVAVLQASVGRLLLTSRAATQASSGG
jgi:hypothetical protein